MIEIDVTGRVWRKHIVNSPINISRSRDTSISDSKNNHNDGNFQKIYSFWPYSYSVLLCVSDSSKITPSTKIFTNGVCAAISFVGIS